MGILLYKNITYSTFLTEEQVIKALQANTEPEEEWEYPWNRHGTPFFKGSIHTNKFEVRQVYVKGEGPWVSGKIKTKADKTEIKITIQFSEILAIFIITALVLALIIGVIVCIIDISKDTFSPVVFIPFGILSAVYSVLYINFKIEVTILQNKFREIFKAEIISPTSHTPPRA